MLAYSHWLALSFQCNNASVRKEEGSWTLQQRLPKKGRLSADRSGFPMWGAACQFPATPIAPREVSLQRDTLSLHRVLNASPGLPHELRDSSVKHGATVAVGLLPWVSPFCSLAKLWDLSKSVIVPVSTMFLPVWKEQHRHGAQSQMPQ